MRIKVNEMGRVGNIQHSYLVNLSLPDSVFYE